MHPRVAFQLMIAASCAALLLVRGPLPAHASGIFNSFPVDSSADVGYHASLAYDNLGVAHIAAYDQTNGDLRYATFNGSTWSTEIVEGDTPAVNVGLYSSLAFDSQNRPHVSYYDQTNGDLRYAVKISGTWNTEVVDAAIPPRGWFTSLALDAAGNPRISYFDQTTGDLKYAAKSGATWVRETVDSGGSTGWYTSLVLDASGNPRISYFDLTNQDLRFASRSGSLWTLETVDATGCRGSYTSLLLRGGNPVIAYYDCTNGDLRLAEKISGNWVLTPVDEAGDVGAHASLGLAPDGQPRIAYQDVGAGGLKYAWRSSGGAWTTCAVDPSSAVVYYCSLVVDGLGVPHIAFQDYHGGDPTPGPSRLRYAEVSFPSSTPEGGAAPVTSLRVTPNPIVTSAHVALVLERAAEQLTVAVFDVAGRAVTRLHDAPAAAGTLEITWDGRTADGTPASAGLYYIRARGAGVDEQARVVLVR